MSSSACGLECYAANKVEFKHETKGKRQQHAVVSLTRSVPISTRGFVCSVCSDTLKIELTDGTKVQLAYGTKVLFTHGPNPNRSRTPKAQKASKKSLNCSKECTLSKWRVFARLKGAQFNIKCVILIPGGAFPGAATCSDNREDGFDEHHDVTEKL